MRTFNITEQKILALVARGYRPKSHRRNIVPELRYIRRLLAGIRKEYGVHNMRELLAELETDAFADAPEIRLSPRGKDVLSLLAVGATYRQVSESLGMGVGDVRRHIEKMRWQNDCESMLELIAKYHSQSKFAKNGVLPSKPF
jgi:DNA-binding CsgD family transcriptional regulator